MELKKFVSETLISIMHGVEDAQTQLKEQGSTSVINATKDLSPRGEVHSSTNPKRRDIENIELDVAVTSSSIESKGNKGKLNIKVIQYDSNKGSSGSNSATSRIKFSIPIAYPAS